MPCWHSQVKRKKEKVKGVRLFTCSFLLLTCYVAAAGCALFQPREPELPLRVATVDELTGLLKAREKAIQTVKGSFTAQVKGPGVLIAHTVYGAVFYRRADALRLKGFGRFGGSLFDFMLEPGRYVLKLPEEDKLISGFPGELAQREEISEPLKLSILAMSGLIGIVSVAPGEWTVMSEDEDRYRLEVYASRLTAKVDTPLRRIWFDRRSFQVVREERLTPTGEVEGILELGDFRNVGGSHEGSALVADQTAPGEPLVLPFAITAESTQGRARIRIQFTELVPNIPLQDKELRVAALSPTQGNGEWCEAARC